MTSVSLGLQARLGSNSSDFGLLGEQSSPKWQIPCSGRRQTTVQNFDAASFIFTAEKSVTVQTNKQTNTNSNRYIHTLPVGMCG